MLTIVKIDVAKQGKRVSRTEVLPRKLSRQRFMVEARERELMPTLALFAKYKRKYYEYWEGKSWVVELDSDITWREFYKTFYEAKNVDELWLKFNE